MNISLIPESAPFDDVQRAWLNGFFAGMLGIQDAGNESESVPSAVDQVEADADAEAEDFPWHDVSLSIHDRMQLAAGRPRERRMMAAMAQLNCGACGYLCQTYAEAIASGEERNLMLCAPGGRETSKMLKQLIKEEGTAGLPSAKRNERTTPKDTSADDGWTRSRPYPAKLIESRPLNGSNSSKDTRHVAIDLGDSGLTYHVGDSLGIYPTNCGELVNEIILQLNLDRLEMVTRGAEAKPLHEVLQNDVCLKDPTEELLSELSAVATSIDDRRRLDALIEFDEPLDGCDVLDALRMAPTAQIEAQRLVDSLAPMNPRLYSIASSLKRHPGQVHLTVGRVSWQGVDRVRKGTASTMLADRVGPGDEIRIFVHPSHGFRVPEDSNAPMIMVGPGTGIAPFLAFLQEREATHASGKNWLLFGDQHETCDFLYRDRLVQYFEGGLLERLDTAFSRDQEQKIYVQDRMREHAEELWRWLETGAYFFVCGDASRMAVDVDTALRDIITGQGHVSQESARDYINRMTACGRYQRDVY